MYSYNDLSGKKFNRLTAIKIVGRNKYGKFVWECNCDCGNKVNAIGSELISGHTKSCGCLHREILESCGKANRKYFSVEEEKQADRVNNSKAKHKRRANEKSVVNDLTKEDIQFLELFQNNKCASCGKDITKNYHIDHMLPVSKGGGLTLRNVQLLCPHCNLSKSANCVDYIGYHMFTGGYPNG